MLLSLDVEVLEGGRLGQELSVVHQGAVEVELAAGHPHAQFAEAAEQVFLDLSGHAGLLGALAARGVRIGVGREGAVEFGRLVRADARIDLEVMVEQTAHDVCRLRLGHGGLEHFVDGEAQLGHHVPIDGAESLVAEEGAGAAGEGLVVEDALVDGFNLLLLGGHKWLVLSGQRSQGCAKRLDVVEVAVEVESAVAVLRHDVAVARRHERGEELGALDSGRIHVVLVEEAGQVLVGVEDVAVLVLPKQGAGLEGVEHREALARGSVGRSSIRRPGPRASPAGR